MLIQSNSTPTVTVADNGHVFVTQGIYCPAFYLARHEVPRFLADPASAAIVLIPPFGATALDCYVASVHLKAIELSRDLAISEDFSLLFETQTRRIGYFSDVTAVERPVYLASRKIEVVVTPQMLATVDTCGAAPAVAIVTGLPRPEKPDYRHRFACSIDALRDAVTAALNRPRVLFYEN